MAATILHVDDHEAGRYARTRFLSRAGFNVVEAGTGEEAVRRARENSPDLILLDINLPDFDGFEVCRRIKADPETERIPVIFLSAARLADLDVVAGLELGADNYLREPVDPSVLVATVKALLRAREAEEALAQSNEHLRRFAFVVSHELQEPLRMVKAYTQMLDRKYAQQLEPEAGEYMHYAIDGVERMEKFIRDMLSYSQSVNVSLDLKRVPSRLAVDMALLELEAAIRESGAAVHVSDLPEIVADATRLSQVFRNLVGNAIKYRSENPPVIRIEASDVENAWIFSVSDNGIGIEPRYSDTIFGLFKRLHGREKSGSGVGLAICKEIVERHGGSIWVEPRQQGSGSKFLFSVPKNL